MLSQNEPVESAIPQDQEIKLIKQLEKVLASGSQPKIVDTQANVRTMHLVAARRILHENGLMDKDIFTSFFEK